MQVDSQAALNARADQVKYMTHIRFPTRFLGMDVLKTEQSFQVDSQATLIFSFDMLSMGVCTARHWQASGRLGQGLNVCNVL